MIRRYAAQCPALFAELREYLLVDELVPDTLDTLAECINCEDRAILRQVPYPLRWAQERVARAAWEGFRLF